MNREQFLKARELKTVEVEVPEWGTVKMRELTDSQKVREWELWLRPGEKINRQRMQDARLKIIALCAVDDQGNRLVGDEDFPILRDHPAAVIQRLSEVALSLCGLSDDDIGDKLKKTSTD